MFSSLLEGSVHHGIDCRRSPVAGDKAFAEIPGKVVVGSFATDIRDLTKASRHPPLHSKPWEFADDPCHFGGRDELILQADDIEADAGCAQRHLGFLVEADRRCRVEGDAVPDQLSATFVEAAVPDEGSSQIGAFHFETARPGKVLIERDVMQQGSDSDNFRVVLDILNLSEPRREKPGSDHVIEQVGFTSLTSIFDCSANNRRVGERNPCKRAPGDRIHIGDLSFTRDD
ncbi:hypothetical protein [Mesorhizobium sp. M0276]|uniref:hypothetical protein n=1 Tax=Mesorhizobium sp. M0276 TaxID=2956928 RepID=UPI00333AA038